MALWALSSVAGIGGTAWLLATGRPLLAVVYGLALLLVAGVLWGRQWGAAVVAAIGLPFIAPAVALVLLATGALCVLDLAAKRWDKPLPNAPASAAADALASRTSCELSGPCGANPSA
ncbi:MAG: hypothetical protein ACKV2O_22000 [Acidimicrobiales bacterium]